MPLFRPLLMFALALPLAACAQSDAPRKPPRLLTNEQGCSITIDNQPTNPYQNPSPVDRACVGPYQLELPQSYFYNQMGPWHDGSFSLAMEFPTLQPFRPGELISPSVDVAVRIVRIHYAYVSRIDVRQAFRSAYMQRPYAPDDPAASLEGRIRGGAVHGLVPYFIDMEKVRRYQKARGIREDASVMKPDSHYDWYVSRDASGTINQLIECTPREIVESGVEYRDGKMVKKRVKGLAKCRQRFIVEELSTIVEVSYPREGLADWKQMEARSRELLMDGIKVSAGK